MKRFGRQFLCYWAPLLVWMAVIFALSSLSKDTIIAILGGPAPGESFDLSPLHLVEFAILAALAYWAFRTIERLSRPALGGLVLAFTMLYAIFDEAYQAIIPGRSPSIIDLGLDLAGGVVGLVVADLLLRRLRRHSQRLGEAVE